MSNKKVYIFACEPETGELIEAMSKHIEGGTEALFQRSILLMGIALKAQKTGSKLAIVDKDSKLIEVIDGV